MDYESCDGDISGCDCYTPVAVTAHVQLIQPHDNSWWGRIGAGECDAVGCFHLCLIPFMIVQCTELASLKFRIIGLHAQPGAPGRVEHCIRPGADVDISCGSGDFARECFYANICVFGYIESV